MMHVHESVCGVCVYVCVCVVVCVDMCVQGWLCVYAAAQACVCV